MASDLEAGELQGQDLAALPASASLEQRVEGGGTTGVSSETKGRSQVQVRSTTEGNKKKKQGIYCLGTKMRNKFPHSTRGASSLLSSFLYLFFCLLPENSRGLCAALPPHFSPDSLRMIYWS